MAVPERLGPFRLGELLGGGGMGVVYRATEDELDREGALKIIRPEHLYFPGARERFRREVETIAGLQHPGIVPVYVVGEQDGVPYLAMECIEGCTLADVLRRARGRAAGHLTGRDFAQLVDSDRSGGPGGDANTSGDLFAGTWEQVCLRIVARVAEALEHAHQRGVLHRDLKPSNVMVTAGDVERGGASRVMLFDFGLATTSRATRLTRSGAHLGSLPYMSPEQTAGTEHLGPATDVYSLGVTLYELLTLKPAFDPGTGRGAAGRHPRRAPAGTVAPEPGDLLGGRDGLHDRDGPRPRAPLRLGRRLRARSGPRARTPTDPGAARQRVAPCTPLGAATPGACRGRGARDAAAGRRASAVRRAGVARERAPSGSGANGSRTRTWHSRQRISVWSERTRSCRPRWSWPKSDARRPSASGGAPRTTSSVHWPPWIVCSREWVPTDWSSCPACSRCARSCCSTPSRSTTSCSSRGPEDTGDAARALAAGQAAR